jgi:hypothetical protein
MTDDAVRDLWHAYRAGKEVPCPADGHAMAMAVDGAMGCYRIVCVTCGSATPWFEAKGEGIRVRGQSSPPPLG